MELFKDLVNNYVHPYLKGKGFKKGNLNWNREVGEVVHVINIQKSQYNDSSSYSFTINVGVYLEFVDKICWDKSRPKIVSETACVARNRIGRLMRCGDIWWTIVPETEITQIKEEVINGIQNYVLPFLESNSSIAEIGAYLNNTLKSKPRYGLEYIQVAIVKYYLSDKIGSFEILDDLIKRKIWEERAIEVKSRLEKMIPLNSRV